MYIKNSPAYFNIVREWFLKNHFITSHGDYFRSHRDLFRGIMTGGPFQGQVYICSIHSLPNLSRLLHDFRTN
jgi:hypothetical protein